MVSHQKIPRYMRCQVPMGQVVIGENSVMHHVNYKICNDIENKKHCWCQSWMGSTNIMKDENASVLNVKKLVCEYYIDLNNYHACKKCSFYGITRLNIMFDQVMNAKKGSFVKPLICYYIPSLETR